MKKTIQIFTAVLIFAFSGYTQTAVLSGTISDVSAKPIPRASVHVLNTNFGAVTDPLGKFAISSMDAGEYTLQVSAIGYATIEKRIILLPTQGEPLTIQLKPSSTQLDAVIVS